MKPLALPHALAARHRADFEAVFKREVEALAAARLPLQQGLAASSAVADEAFRVMLLDTETTATQLRVKAGVCYAGLVGGCSCADDPTPVEAQPEYCELWFEIDLADGATRVRPADAPPPRTATIHPTKGDR